MTRFVSLLFVLPVVLACGSGQPAACGGRATQPMTKAPAIDGPSVDGGTPLGLAAGRVTVLNVWGSWCGPCEKEQPALNRAAAENPDVVFLGLDVQDNQAAAQEFRRRFAVPYPSISDPSRERAGRIGVVSTPGTAVVGADGTIRALAQAPVDVDTLTCMIDLGRQ